MIAKVYVEKENGKMGWLFGRIKNGYFVLPSGRSFKIDDDGNINYNGQIVKVMTATY